MSTHPPFSTPWHLEVQDRINEFMTAPLAVGNKVYAQLGDHPVYQIVEILAIEGDLYRVKRADPRPHDGWKRDTWLIPASAFRRLH